MLSNSDDGTEPDRVLPDTLRYWRTDGASCRLPFSSLPDTSMSLQHRQRGTAQHECGLTRRHADDRHTSELGCG
jgi:hypothetical protein